MKEDLNLNAVTQEQYEGFKKLDNQAVSIIHGFVLILDEELSKQDTYIQRMYDYKNGLDYESREVSRKFNILLELCKERKIQEDKYIRYYYDDVFKVIKQPVKNQIILLKRYTKKMIVYCNSFVDVQKLRTKPRKLLDQLKKEEENLFDKK